MIERAPCRDKSPTCYHKRGDLHLGINPERVTFHHTQACMALARQHVLGGFTLWSEATMVRSPDRYIGERGHALWNTLRGEMREQALTLSYETFWPRGLQGRGDMRATSSCPSREGAHQGAVIRSY
jgi:hypothetical protein